MRTFIVRDESNKYGPCFAIRERKRIGRNEAVWEFIAYSRTREQAESTARGLGQLMDDVGTIDWH